MKKVLWLAPLVLMLIGCSEPQQPGSVSSVVLRFDPMAQFQQRGFAIERAAGAGRFSPREAYVWRPFQGSLVLPDEAAGCESVAVAIREALGAAVQGAFRDGLQVAEPRDRGKPYYGTLDYIKDGMRGSIFVWLFPNESETRIRYAILLHEERLPNDQHPLPPI